MQQGLQSARARLPRADLLHEIGRVEAIGVKTVTNHKVTDVLAEQSAGTFDAVFIAIGASLGKRAACRDLALQAIAYGNVYIAQIAMGANPQQTLQAFREAEAYRGPSLILAYREHFLTRWN